MINARMLNSLPFALSYLKLMERDSEIVYSRRTSVIWMLVASVCSFKAAAYITMYVVPKRHFFNFL